MKTHLTWAEMNAYNARVILESMLPPYTDIEEYTKEEDELATRYACDYLRLDLHERLMRDLQALRDRMCDLSNRATDHHLASQYANACDPIDAAIVAVRDWVDPDAIPF